MCHPYSLFPTQPGVGDMLQNQSEATAFLCPKLRRLENVISDRACVSAPPTAYLSSTSTLFITCPSHRLPYCTSGRKQQAHPCLEDFTPGSPQDHVGDHRTSVFSQGSASTAAVWYKFLFYRNLTLDALCSVSLAYLPLSMNH